MTEVISEMSAASNENQDKVVQSIVNLIKSQNQLHFFSKTKKGGGDIFA